MIAITTGMIRDGKFEIGSAAEPLAKATRKNTARKPNQMTGKTRL